MKSRITSFVSAASAVCLGMWTAYYIVQREEPVTIFAAEAVNPVVERGADLRVSFWVNRNRSCAVSADQIIYDKLKTRMTLPDLELKPGLKLGEDKFIHLVPIPPDAEPGYALYVLNPNYVCNFTQRIWPIAPSKPVSVPFIIR